MIKKGQVVSSSLYNRGEGIVVNIEGEQRPETCQKMRSVGVTGGNAYFNIIFNDGSKSNIPESILLKSVQWKVFDKVVSEFEIFQAIKKNEEYKKKCKEADEKKKKEREEEEIKLFSEYKHLKRTSKEESPTVTAAKNIRQELKQAFPGIKFRVRKEHYRTINVDWSDGVPVAEVEKITNKYYEGHFNGMEDIYEYNNSVFPKLFGGAEYIFENRTMSESTEAMLKPEIEKYYGINLSNEREVHERFRCWPSTLIYRELRERIFKS